MKVKVRNYILELTVGDITEQEVDAIGNAANSGLRGGGGVDGAIHRVGGPTIMQELKSRYEGCPTGSAVETGAGNLKARHVMHAVGPIYRGQEEDAKLLAGAYRSCLTLALDNRCKSIALPSISTGVYGYPIAEASRIALETVIDFLMYKGGIDLVRFVLFSENDFKVYREAALELARDRDLITVEKKEFLQ
jgi:O-acetyl-ADP-ribose deacetylase